MNRPVRGRLVTALFFSAITLTLIALAVFLGRRGASAPPAESPALSEQPHVDPPPRLDRLGTEPRTPVAEKAASSEQSTAAAVPRTLRGTFVAIEGGVARMPELATFSLDIGTGGGTLEVLVRDGVWETELPELPQNSWLSIREPRLGGVPCYVLAPDGPFTMDVAQPVAVRVKTLP